MDTAEIQASLTHLAQERTVSASTQNQALSALLFLYHHVLHKEIEPVLLSTAKRPQRLPPVLSCQEVLVLLEYLNGPFKLMTQLLCGSGLYLTECLRLRIKDVDFERHPFVTHLLQAGYEIRTLQERLGHKGICTTMIHTQTRNTVA